MTVSQELLERFRREGTIQGDVVKVDSFLNHMVDPLLMEKIGQDLAARFANQQIDKIITAESSGIMIAQAVATALKIPFVFAKKKRSITMKKFYTASSYSFTKQEATTLYVSHEVLQPGEKILFVDDFFAKGTTLKALTEIIRQARAELVGCAVIINKSKREDILSVLHLDELKALKQS
ncbi:MAG: xanthine phosphoribosyltransferase [Pelovirga sp.]